MLNRILLSSLFFLFLSAAAQAESVAPVYQCPFLFDPTRHVDVPLTQGRDGWFFRATELKEHFTLLPETARFLKRLNHAFANEGSALVLMQVPLRGISAVDFLLKDQPMQRQFNPSLALKRYQHYLQSLRETGIPIASMIEESRKADSESKQYFFLRRDIHWSPFGASLAAGRVAELIHSLPEYQGVTPVVFETTKTGMLSKKDIFERGLQELCTDILPAEDFPAYTTSLTSEASGAGKTGEDALFGDGAAASGDSNVLVLLGSSFSAVRDFNFEGFLAEKTGMEVANFAMSAGELFNSIISYASLPKAERLSPRFVVWENLAHYDMNQGERMFRQIIPAIEGECNAEEAIARQTLRIEKGKAQEIFSLSPEQKIYGSDYYFYIHSDNLGLARFTLDLDYVDGDGEWFAVDRTVHFNNTGRFFAELSDEIPSPLTHVSIGGMDDLNANVEIRLCKTKHHYSDTEEAIK